MHSATIAPNDLAKCFVIVLFILDSLGKLLEKKMLPWHINICSQVVRKENSLHAPIDGA